MRKIFGVLVLVAAFIGLLVVLGVFYVVNEQEQVILTQFGQPVGGVVTEAGVHFKVPFIQKVNRFEKRVLEWDGPASQMQTKEKLYIIVETFARWRITDPLKFFKSMRDERTALSRLDDIVGGETRNTIARHQLVELIRTTKGRQPMKDETLAKTDVQISTLSPISAGRVVLEKEVSDQARAKLTEFGIDLLDVRFMRINYNQAVSSKIYERMMSERKQIAERFRSEGAGEAAKILGTRERELRQIESEAYRQVQMLQGKADAEAIRIYAEAFNQTAEAREFYEFQRSLETYRTALDRTTTVVLSTENGFLRHLKGESLAPGSKAGAAALQPPKAPAPATPATSQPPKLPPPGPAPVAPPAPPKLEATPPPAPPAPPKP